MHQPRWTDQEYATVVAYSDVNRNTEAPARTTRIAGFPAAHQFAISIFVTHLCEQTCHERVVATCSCDDSAEGIRTGTTLAGAWAFYATHLREHEHEQAAEIADGYAFVEALAE